MLWSSFKYFGQGTLYHCQAKWINNKKLDVKFYIIIYILRSPVMTLVDLYCTDPNLVQTFTNVRLVFPNWLWSHVFTTRDRRSWHFWRTLSHLYCLWEFVVFYLWVFSVDVFCVTPSLCLKLFFDLNDRRTSWSHLFIKLVYFVPIGNPILE